MPQRSLRDAILSAATEEFHLHGYSATGVSTITDAASAPKGSFYNHFASKEALAIEALAQYSERYRPLVLNDRSLTPIDRIYAHFSYAFSLQRSWNFERGCMTGNFGAEASAISAELRGAVAQNYQRLIGAFRVVLSEAIDNGDLPADTDAELTASLLVDGWEGALLRSKAYGTGEPIRQFVESSIPRLLGLS